MSTWKVDKPKTPLYKIFPLATAYKKDPVYFINASKDLAKEDGYTIDFNSKFTNASTNSNGNLTISNTIFLTDEKHRISLTRDKSSLSFIDCIFSKRLLITGKCKRLYFDNCIFLDNFSNGMIDSYDEIELHRCSIGELTLYEHKVDSISISSSYINYLSIFGMTTESIRTYENTIKHIEFYDNSYNKLTFSPHQVVKANPGSLFFEGKLKRAVVYKRKYSYSSSNNFHWPKSSIKQRLRMALIYFVNLLISLRIKISEYIQINTGTADDSWHTSLFNNIKTLNFLKNETYYSLIPSTTPVFERITNSILYKKRLSKPIILIFGHLMRLPSIFIVAVSTLITYAMLYCFFGRFKIDNELVSHISVLDSLYFSAITFLTIGYGDIVPLGYVRILAVTEGFLGVLLSGLFLVILARTFIGK